MDIICPLCNHNRSERLALTYARGTSHSVSTSVGAMAGGGISPLTALLGFLFFPVTIGLGAAGFVGMGVMRTWTRTQTGLAAESAPPKQLSWLAISLMTLAYIVTAPVVGMLILAWEQSHLYPASVSHAKHITWHMVFTQHTGATVTMLVSMAVLLALIIWGLVLGIRGMLQRRNVDWARREAGWQRTFLCNRCGANFLVPDYDPYGVNVVRSDRMGKGEYLPRAETRRQRETVEGKAAQDNVRMRGKRR